MKTKKIVAIVLWVASSTWTQAQDFNEKITKELTFEKKSAANTVLLANINGNIKIMGYDGDKILVEVNKKITAKTETRLEKGKKEIQLGIIDRADTLILYVDGACNNFGRQNSKNHRHGRQEGWGYNWNDCNGRNSCRMDYDYKMDFTLKVPSGVNLLVSTVNDGDITVENMKGAVYADNVNGSIKLSNLVREVKATTINGDVDVDYSRNPDKDSRFYTLNGDINANFQKGLGASVSFESFNGSFYTNIDQLESLPVALLKEQQGDGIKYKVNGNRYKVGKGGVNLEFETFNGNVYVKEKNN
jgi:DUF4097 and DUF4098 domain-containing protein YvlB